MPVTKPLKYAALCLLCLYALMLPACGDLLSKPAPMHIITMLPYTPATPMCSTPLPVQLVVDLPSSTAGLNTDRIAILLDEREIQYAAEYKWDTPVPFMVQHMLVGAFNTTGCVLGAGTSLTGLNTPYRLLVDMKRMHFMRDRQNKEKVEVLFHLTLLDAAKGKVIAMQEVYATRQGPYGNALQLGSAMEEAVHEVVEQTVTWSRDNLAAYHREEPEKAQPAK